jgi:hypothetical protein
MAGTRADHYVWADEFLWKARRLMGEPHQWAGEEVPKGARVPRVELLLMAAQVHATLAAAGPGVEQAVIDNEKAIARALGATENDQRARQAARPPLHTCSAPDGPDECRGCRAEATTTCRCTGLPHDLGSPGCSVPGMNKMMGVEETAGTVRPKPGPPHVATGCRCGRPVGAHQRGATGCAHEPPDDGRPYCRCPGGGGLDGQHRRGVPRCTR